MQLNLSYKEFFEKIAEENSKIQANDDRFDNNIIIYHHDGIIQQDQAFAEVRGEFLVAFGEHTPPFIVHLDEIDKWANFKWDYPSNYDYRVDDDEN